MCGQQCLKGWDYVLASGVRGQIMRCKWKYMHITYEAHVRSRMQAIQPVSYMESPAYLRNHLCSVARTAPRLFFLHRAQPKLLPADH